jgi:hypothetical protein
MAPTQQPLPDVQLAQMLNALMARAGWQRTQDTNPPRLLRNVVPAATSAKGDWYGPIPIQKPSVIQLLTVAGVDVTHQIYGINAQPEDLTISEGRGTPNAVGRVYALQVGDWYIYVPLLTGDPASYNIRISDASSDLPAQQNALGDGGAVAGITIVSSLNRASFRALKKTVAVPGTAEQLTTQAVPGGFKITVRPLSTNTGSVWIAETQAKAQAALHPDAWEFSPGDAPLNLNLTDWSAIWVDAAVAAEGIRITSEV